MSHLREHKFKHNFQGCLNPICSCGLDIESTSHFLLHCPERYTLLSTLNNADCKLLELTKSFLSQTLLYGNTLFDKEKKTFLTQQLNIFYLLKDSKSLLFSKFPSESLNPSRSFLKCFIIFTSYPYTLSYFLYLVSATFKFTVLYNNFYRKKNVSA